MHWYYYYSFDAVLMIGFNLIIIAITDYLTWSNSQHNQWELYDFETYHRLNHQLMHFLIVLMLSIVFASPWLNYAKIIDVNTFYFNLIFNTIVAQYAINVYLWHYAQIDVIDHQNAL